MGSVVTIILFNPPPEGLASIGVPLPRAVAVVRHVEMPRTVEILRLDKGEAALALWAAPTAEAEQAATDLIDVLARNRVLRSILVVIDSCEVGAGTAIAEVMHLPWTHRVDCGLPGVDLASALERFLAPVNSAGGSLVEAPRTLSRLWGAAVGCYRHDRANAIRRLLQHGSSGDLAGAHRYLAEHGEVILARLVALDRMLVSAAEWYLAANKGAASDLASILAERREMVSQLVQGTRAPSVQSFLESEARFREQLSTERPRLSTEKSL